jgi:hypothetical protein
MSEELSNLEKAGDMCRHMNFPSKCAECNKEKPFSALQRIAEIVSPEDLAYLEKTLDIREGQIGGLFDPSGKYLHSSTETLLAKMVESGDVKEGVSRDDAGETVRKVRLTDADSDMGLTYNAMLDDARSSDGSKAFSSGKYFDQAEDLASDFWSTDEKREQVIAYIKEKRPDLTIDSQDDLVAFFEDVKQELVDRERQESPGVTIVFDKTLFRGFVSQDGVDTLNRDWEHRYTHEDGIPAYQLKTIFVPADRMSAVREMLQGTYLEHKDLRSSEELEVVRMLKKIDSENSYKPAFDTPEKVECIRTRTRELIEHIKEGDVDVLFFMDRSARPLSVMLREAWQDDDGVMPKIKFLNIGREKIGVLGGDHHELRKRYDEDDGEWKVRVKEYWDKLDSSGYLEEVTKDVRRGLKEGGGEVGEKIKGTFMLVDDVKGSGFSIDTARDFMEYSFPDALIAEHIVFNDEDGDVFKRTHSGATWLPWNSDKTYTLMSEDEDLKGVTANVETDSEKRAVGLMFRKEVKQIFS